ncbi:serine/threonine-protein kinase bud32 [Friedmanniomyces endolithicus]|uniref:EKC/KEOPS complex subunit BUD32 n=1 Tax=Friedmanniomyces endolithicus TaxID=329885 RepID=A0AAN6KEY4_9PEZI|nr:serine/threonine-protein kinase bud32 [Friedmanniomyces endolithicus]KAK0792662.1 serine/threonine-protein kinase bud32 [Friedmanniomyces endolithicus]KAK0794645.1 serine/threonine-protein kinase bud32 [Friedmanniomyces endolithicus]KAK0840519.1 serine/threonine-protein kinase bud32 [Friedmanniomyces endolithicus]KAK0853917.1 serine/threonine-protein kinase bud32 [Friedmanniomyces endolithicus]
MTSPVPPSARERLPIPFNNSPEPFELIAQGAESLLYKTTFLSPSQPAALKIRPVKKWRHPTLDKRLTRARILAEARVLVKLSGEGIVAGGGGRKVKDPKKGDVGAGGMRGLVPGVLGLDWEGGWLVTEWIEGGTVKEAIYRVSRARTMGGSGVGLGGDDEVEELRGLLRKMGEVVGKLHACGVVHGDLTTSNMMLRPLTTIPDNSFESDGHDETSPQPSGAASASMQPQPTTTPNDSLSGDLVLIDFGLATQSVSDEDRAVDLYVLERAFGSTHPREEELFACVLDAYAHGEGSGMQGKAGKTVIRKLEDVRMRGRKKRHVVLFTGRGPAMPLRLLRGPDLDVFTEKALLPKGTQVSEPANMKAGDTSGASLHC